jgi:asparagine synthase (glutamine-hydrolysing)
MCGIAGILSSEPMRLGAVIRMTEVQRHRGPDDLGYVFIDGQSSVFTQSSADSSRAEMARLALGHRRLSILDRSSAGRQPMSTQGDRYWISYNGEVYNYLELRQELQLMGFRFSTGTDTEVILSAYVAWGTSCFARFNGMWGMAIWDGRRRQLILSRDRLGVKPLYYVNLPHLLLFSSEIKGLLASNYVSPQLDQGVAIDYLKWATVNHDQRTFFKGIHSFPAGHFAEIDWDQPTEWKAEPFWSLTAPEHAASISMNDASDRFHEVFSDAVAKRMRSDVPVGSCLSGGLDSSAIVCVANLLGMSDRKEFHTFTSCSPDPRFDERQWSDLVNVAVGATPHHVMPEPHRFLEDLEAVLWHQEEPFTSASMYAQWLVMSEARRAKVPVLLDGQGADEALCGYRKFYVFYLQELVQAHRWKQFLVELGQLLLHGDRGILRWREGRRYLPSRLQSRLWSLRNLLRSEMRKSWEMSTLQLSGRRSVAERQVIDLLRFSLPALLRYEDRNSMAWSVETRVPFLDYRLVEFLISLPVSRKLARGRTKALMREGLKGVVPQQILDRRDKVGFVTSQEAWMKQEWSSAILHRFSSKHFRLAGFLRQESLVESFRAYMAGSRSVSQNDLFRVFILDAWMERFHVAD